MRNPTIRGLMPVLALWCFPATSYAQAILGQAQVIDGDSLRIGEVELRLYGVDAPELTQECFSDDGPVECGTMAREALEGLIGGQAISCFPRDIDAFGRTVAQCRVSGSDLGEALVEAGWATAFQRYTSDYVRTEARARAAKIGVWQWQFQPPEQYRTSQLAADEEPTRARPSGASVSRSSPQRAGNDQCVIKGNHSRRGEWIYHLPGMPYYDATRPEAWFCTEAEAQAAGYRRAIVR